MKALFLLATCAATAAAQTTALIRAEGWRHLFDPEPTDPGIGVIAFRGTAAASVGRHTSALRGTGRQRPDRTLPVRV